MSARLSGENISIGIQGLAPFVEQFDFFLKPGEIVALMGANGVGKSTFLRSLIGLLNLHEGNLFINGESYLDKELEHRAKIISFASTHRSLDLALKVKDIIALGRYPFRNVLSREENKRIVEETIQDFSLEKLSNRSFSTLSDGQKQKVLIARAICQKTEVLLLDEPMSFLDIGQKYEILHTLKEVVKKNQSTILFSTHDWDMVLSSVNKMWILKDRKILETTPEEYIVEGADKKLYESKFLNFSNKTGHYHLIHKNTHKVNLRWEEGTQSCDSEVGEWVTHFLRKNHFLVVENCDEESIPQVHLNKMGPKNIGGKMFFGPSSDDFHNLSELIDLLVKTSGNIV
jgi:iron complex transport system ATP-binding protein